MGVAEIVALIALVIQYGAPVVQAAIEAWNKPVITLDDIKSLETLCKPPDQY